MRLRSDLGRRQLPLQGAYVLIGLQVGIVLDDREEGPQGAGEGALSRCGLGWTAAPAATAFARAAVTRVSTACSKPM